MQPHPGANLQKYSRSACMFIIIIFMHACHAPNPIPNVFPEIVIHVYLHLKFSSQLTNKALNLPNSQQFLIFNFAFLIFFTRRIVLYKAHYCTLLDMFSLLKPYYIKRNNLENGGQVWFRDATVRGCIICNPCRGSCIVWSGAEWAVTMPGVSAGACTGFTVLPRSEVGCRGRQNPKRPPHSLQVLAGSCQIYEEHQLWKCCYASRQMRGQNSIPD